MIKYYSMILTDKQNTDDRFKLHFSFSLDHGVSIDKNTKRDLAIQATGITNHGYKIDIVEVTKEQYIEQRIPKLEKDFWDYYPHETSWSELKEINADLYNNLQSIGLELVKYGKLNPAYLRS
jgi:hypothetical protein